MRSASKGPMLVTESNSPNEVRPSIIDSTNPASAGRLMPVIWSSGTSSFGTAAGVPDPLAIALHEPAAQQVDVALELDPLGIERRGHLVEIERAFVVVAAQQLLRIADQRRDREVAPRARLRALDVAHVRHFFRGSSCCS